MNYETTRRFSRTLGEAFPDEQTPVFERCTPNHARLADKAVAWTLVISAVVVVLVVAFGGQP